MGETRLGKLHLRWCVKCDVPVLEERICGLCAGETKEVRLTPPGDARPAFPADIRRIREVINRQFGDGMGSIVLPEGRAVVLNKAPDIDRMDEVILDGEVVGGVRFTLASGERFLPRPIAAASISTHMSRGWVSVDDTAAKAIREKNASALAVGIDECDETLVPGAEVIVLDKDRKAVSVGVSKMGADEIAQRKRGTAVKTRWTVGEDQRHLEGKDATWKDVIAANARVISRRVEEAKKFIHEVSSRNDLPVAVSYSGGKDSLATLLLVLEAGIRPHLFFVDTGLEFQETRENVNEVARDHSLELTVESAGDAFWKNLDTFGPPAKDYRWCCKTCKLGPATRLIHKNFPGGVLSFIGQRAYESEQRSKKGKVWRNPWTPNQLAASPIQKWTALHVWLYLFSRNARYNTLYEKGLERIGCMMCPATDLAELRHVKGISREYERWQKYLDTYASRTGKSDVWLSHDLWRWRRIPQSVLAELGEDSRTGVSGPPQGQDSETLTFRSTKGYSPCVDGMSMEGAFSKPLKMERVANMLNIIGEVTTSSDGDIAEVGRTTVFAEGPVMIRAKTMEELDRRALKLKEIVTRAMNCAGCGICIGRCEAGALHLEGQVTVDPAKCTHCGACLGPCPVVRFSEQELDI
ncbi:MAG TPA: phosphoadenosine phosphosulfate reductase family protein [Thermoplasmata archaeon]